MAVVWDARAGRNSAGIFLVLSNSIWFMPLPPTALLSWSYAFGGTLPCLMDGWIDKENQAPSKEGISKALWIKINSSPPENVAHATFDRAASLNVPRKASRLSVPISLAGMFPFILDFRS